MRVTRISFATFAALALAALFDLAGEVNRNRSSRLAGQLRALGHTLGLLQQPPAQFLRGPEDDTAGIELLIAVRATAKKEKNFDEADRVRKALLDKGIVLEDGPGGTTWRRLVARSSAPLRRKSGVSPTYGRGQARAGGERTRHGVHHRRAPARQAAIARRRVRHAGARNCRPADFDQGGRCGVAPLLHGMR